MKSKKKEIFSNKVAKEVCNAISLLSSKDKSLGVFVAEIKFRETSNNLHYRICPKYLINTISHYPIKSLIDEHLPDLTIQCKKDKTLSRIQLVIKTKFKPGNVGRLPLINLT